MRHATTSDPTPSNLSWWTPIDRQPITPHRMPAAGPPCPHTPSHSVLPCVGVLDSQRSHCRLKTGRCAVCACCRRLIGGGVVDVCTVDVSAGVLAAVRSTHKRTPRQGFFDGRLAGSRLTQANIGLSIALRTRYKRQNKTTEQRHIVPEAAITGHTVLKRREVVPFQFIPEFNGQGVDA